MTVGKTAVKVKVVISKIGEKPATDGIVTFSAGEHGTIKAVYNNDKTKEITSGTKLTAGTEILFIAKPDEGYKVANWEPDQSETIKLKSTDDKREGTHTVTGDVTIKVNFAPLSKCKITFSKDASVPTAVIITATAGEGATARVINSGDSIDQGERIEFKATGFDETKYQAVWTIKRGGTPLKKPLQKNPIFFTGSYTNDGRDIDVVLSLEEKVVPTPSGTAKVCDKDKDEITVSGKTNVENALPQYVYIKLTDDTFNTSTVSKCLDISSWFTNLPAGLTAKTDCNETQTLTDENKTLRVQFFGAPTETKTEAIKVTIPKECLTSGKAITVTNNESATFNITEGFIFTHGTIAIDSEASDDTSVTVKADAKIDVLYNPGKGIYVLRIQDALDGITSKTSHKVSCTFKIKGVTTNESVTANVRISGPESGTFKVNINGGIPAANIKDDSTVTATITVKKQGSVTVTASAPIKASASPKQATANATVKITVPIDDKTKLQAGDTLEFIVNPTSITIPDYTILDTDVTKKKCSVTFEMPSPVVDVTIKVQKK